MPRMLFILFFLALWGCKDPYVSPYKSPGTGYLVVEGYISGNTATTFTLTRTIALPGNSALPRVSGAQLTVEGTDNSSYSLANQGNGNYSSAGSLPLSSGVQYRLRINIPNGENYLSDFVPYKVSPPIDSVSWMNSAEGTDIYVNTHDPANNTRYYQWNYDYTYEYRSARQAAYYYDGDTVPPAILPLLPQNQTYRCWMSGSSSTIIVNSTARLSQDVVYLQPLNHIPSQDIALSVLYSIQVRQYVLTQDGFNFLTLMQKNTESLGSIFDAQPSQITGNIHSLTHPTEQVIGYISAGTVQQQRIFISAYQVGDYYHATCAMPDTVLPNGNLEMNFGYGPFAPIYYQTNRPVGWVSNNKDCVDCTLAGGTNQKPSYWPF